MINLPFEINRPLAVFDTETTGVNPATDKIVQLCILKISPDGSHAIRSMIVDPGIPIPKEASGVHKITDEIIAELKAHGKAPLFKSIAKSVHAFISDCDLCAFNGNSFDIPLLAQEFANAGIEDWPKEGTLFLDPMVIYKKKEKRDLSSAMLFYCNETLEEAHDAQADTIAAAKVLVGQIAMYDDLREMTIEQLAEESKYNNNLDLAGKLAYDENGKVIFTFGKYFNKFAYDAFKNDKKYYEWLMGADFTANTKVHFKRLYEMIHQPKQA